MRNDSGRLWWVLALVISGGLFSRPLLERSSSAAPSQAGPAPAGASPAARKTGSEARRTPEVHKDALDVLAQHFGIDLTDDAIAARFTARARQTAFGAAKPTITDE